MKFRIPSTRQSPNARTPGRLTQSIAGRSKGKDDERIRPRKFLDRLGILAKDLKLAKKTPYDVKQEMDIHSVGILGLRLDGNTLQDHGHMRIGGHGEHDARTAAAAFFSDLNHLSLLAQRSASREIPGQQSLQQSLLMRPEVTRWVDGL